MNRSEGEDGWRDVPNLSLRQLAYFLTAANQLSVLRAAEALNVSPSSVSTAISQMERILGVKLFMRRHARGMLLTPAGRDLAVHARSILLHVREIETMGERGGPRAAIRLSIGCLNTLAPYLVPRLMQEVEKEHPKIQARWHEDSHDSLLEGLHSGALDLAILYDYDLPTTVQAITLRTMPVQLVVPAGHTVLQRERLRLANVAKEPFILLDLPKTRDYFLSIFAAERIEPRIGYRTGSFEMLRSMVASGFGYTVLNFSPPYVAPDQGGLVSRPLDGPFRPQELVIARLYRTRPPSRLEQLVETVKASVSKLKTSTG
ncbi:transcriptional regulator, LysR family [Xanthobacter versatilis]|uniref:Transcriptional regulator, LysR family n=1 Tax=Xanthobacter autotrophicus (strain ATCC BAA-1158 / Py2) TaxID=78245 RepID=A7IE51_XANP2|nr:transcriptional regulator, LysR family [Xanthobacter autotrophicus Py2]